MRFSLGLSLLLAMANLGPAQRLKAGDGTEPWPQWRGPDGQGHAAATTTHLPLTWSETQNVRWKTTIPGRGHSSPVLANGQLWITTSFETAAKPEDIERRKKADTGGQPLNILDEVRLHAVCLETSTGRMVRDVEVFRERDPQWVHQQNTYATPTPVIDGNRVYVHFGTFGTACLDTGSGAILWTNRELHVMHENGPGSSPVVWNNRVIFHCDGSDSQFIAGLDAKTGKVAWRTERSGALNPSPQLKKAYGTPLLVEFRGQMELLSPAADWLYSYDPLTGSERWKLSYGCLGFSNVPRPVLGHGMIFLSTGFMRSEMIAVRYDGSQTPEIVWRWKRGVPQTPSPILVGEELYFVSDSGGLLTCLDAKTGQENYQERLGGNFAASPTFADGKLYFHDREGVTSVIKPGPKFEVLARNTLQGPHMASAAVAGACLFLRTDQAVYCLAEAGKP